MTTRRPPYQPAAAAMLGACLALAAGAHAAPAQRTLEGAPAIPARTAQSPAESHVVYYFDQAVELTLDMRRVAVFSTGLRDLRPGDLGVQSAKIRATALPDVSLAKLAHADRTPERIAEITSNTAAARSDAVSFVSPVFFGADGGPMFPTPVILVRIAPDADVALAEKAIEAAGQIVERDWGGTPGAYRVSSNRRNGADLLRDAAELAQRDDVLYAEPDMAFTGRSSFIPNDNNFLAAWGLHNFGQNVGGIGTVDIDMNGPEAWDINRGDASILTLIIDTGVQQNHPDIKQLPGIDLTAVPGVNGGPANACDNHGTPVAACVSGRINNFLGACGIAPDTNTVSARTFISNTPCDGNWTGVTSATVDALAHAEAIGARVTNNSNFYGFTSAAIADKYADTYAAGMVHFASAGNNSGGAITYPASLPTVNAISAITNKGFRAGFSNKGPGLAFGAPGQNIITADRTGTDGYGGSDYEMVDGTSFASPYAAGVAALLLSENDALTSAQVEQIMRDTAKDLGDTGFDEDFGWGLPDAAAALNAAFSVCVADLDGDGDADVDDIEAFVDAFLDGVPTNADIDNDGDEDPDDISAFVAAFITGC